MRDEATHVSRAWVQPEACTTGEGAQAPAANLHHVIQHVDDALGQRSIGKLVHALVVLRGALRDRLARNHSPGSWEDDGPPSGPWQRRLRRRHAASLCAIETLLDAAWTSFDVDAVASDVRDELSRLRHLESLESRAQLELYWTDIGVGD